MQNYADVLEGYLIPAEEGFGDVLKKVGGAVLTGFKTALAFIRKILGVIAQKIRSIFSKKEKKETPKEAKERLEKEKAELEKRITYLEDAVNSGKFKNEQLEKEKDVIAGKHERATKMIADLKDQLNAKDEQISNLKKSKVDSEFVLRFQKTTITFVTHVSMQITKAYSELPKFVENARAAGNFKINERGEEVLEKFDRERMYKMPGTNSGRWRALYASLTGTYIPKIKDENIGFSVFANSDLLAAACDLMVKNADKCISYLEDFAKSVEGNSMNDRERDILSDISEQGGFIDMLKRSITLTNEILTLHESSGYIYDSNRYEAI